MDALECFTVGSSCEFAIRAFILKSPQESMKRMKIWATSDNEHVRRLASEGCRPRLPWAVALPSFKKDPKLVLEILELLKDDMSPYVRKSVANNLNDVSKENYAMVKKIANDWIGYSKNRDAIIKHGCRTLLKNSDSDVLELFGFSKPTGVKIENFKLTQQVKMGENLSFSFDVIKNEKLGNLRMEFALYFLRKNGVHNKKVFKISESNLKENSKHVEKTYSFKPISTRVYHKGLQKLSIIINGVVFQESEFTLF